MYNEDFNCFSHAHIEQLEQIEYECSIFLTIADISDAICSHGWAALMILRAWLIYFDTTYCEISSKGKWTQLIDPNSIKLTTNKWVLRYRNSLGREEWILTRIFIPYYLFVLSIYLLTSIFINSIFQIDLLFYFLLIILLCYIWCKIPRYYDIFQVRYEVILILKVAGFDLLMFIVLAVLEGIITQKQHIKIVIFIFQTIFTFTHWIYALITTKWVITYFRLKISSNGSMANNLVQIVRVQSRTSNSKTNSLIDILCNKESLDVFMNHLCNEWAIESLLCVIECYQLKDLIKGHDVSYQHKLQRLNELILPIHSLPKSIIIYDEELNITDKIKKIVNKYIHIGSEFEINIAYHTRQYVVNVVNDDNKLNNLTEMDLYQLFDQILSDLLDLMLDSYYRFTQTPYYTSVTTP